MVKTEEWNDYGVVTKIATRKKYKKPKKHKIEKSSTGARKFFKNPWTDWHTKVSNKEDAYFRDYGLGVISCKKLVEQLIQVWTEAYYDMPPHNNMDDDDDLFSFIETRFDYARHAFLRNKRERDWREENGG